MAYELTEGDAQHWDWLSHAAHEIELYLQRVMDDETVRTHSVSARAKSIASLLAKIRRKEAGTRAGEVTPGQIVPTGLDDVIAARVIVFSVRDRSRAIEIIRERFSILEDRNPGDDRPVDSQGYDCWHFVVNGVSNHSDLVSDNGYLSRFFSHYHGLEIQVRTVAAHAWAEFEHSLRYKSATYEHLTREGQQQVDAILRDAHVHRKQLDESLDAAMRILDDASPAKPIRTPGARTGEMETGIPVSSDSEPTGQTIDDSRLRAFLATQYPEAVTPTDKGITFALELLAAMEIADQGQLERTLSEVDSAQVASVLGLSSAVTSVRRLDDDLLARFGGEYIRRTCNAGEPPYRERRPGQLDWRWELIGKKTTQA